MTVTLSVSKYGVHVTHKCNILSCFSFSRPTHSNINEPRKSVPESQLKLVVTIRTMVVQVEPWMRDVSEIERGS